MNDEKFVIAVSNDENALYSLINLEFKGTPIEYKLYVRVGYTSQLMIDPTEWDLVPEEQQFDIMNSCASFVKGWEAHADHR